MHNLHNNNIDIACIQETHNEKLESIDYEYYTIIYGGCNTLKNIITNNISRRAGVAIAIKKTLKNNVIKIHRINERIMEVIIKTDKISKISQ